MAGSLVFLLSVTSGLVAWANQCCLHNTHRAALLTRDLIQKSE